MNWINSYNLRSKQILLLFSKENVEHLKVISKLTMEVMKNLFEKERIIKLEDLMEMEDFNIFSEAVFKQIQL